MEQQHQQRIPVKIRTFGTVLNGVNTNNDGKNSGKFIMGKQQVSIGKPSASIDKARPAPVDGTENAAAVDDGAVTHRETHTVDGNEKMAVPKSNRIVKKKTTTIAKKKINDVVVQKSAKKQPSPIIDNELARQWMTASEETFDNRDYYLLQLRCTFETLVKTFEENERLKKEIDTLREQNECLYQLKTSMEQLYDDLFGDDSDDQSPDQEDPQNL